MNGSRTILILAAAATFAAAAIAPSAAFACSCGFPAIDVLAGDEVPENAMITAVVWTDEVGLQDVSLEKNNAGTWETVDSVANLLVEMPNEPFDGRLDIVLTEGEQYRVVDLLGESGLDELASFTVAPPVMSGDFVVGTSVEVLAENAWYTSESASCGIQAPSRRAEITIDLPKDVEPFADSIIWEQRVDGTEYRHVADLCDLRQPGAEFDMTGFELAAPCGPDALGETPSAEASLTPELHTVSYIGYIPGTGVTFTTDPTDVDLSCDSESPDGPSDQNPGEPLDRWNEEGSTCASAGASAPVSTLALFALLIGLRRRD